MKTTYNLRLEKLMKEAMKELHNIDIYPAENIIGIKSNRRAKRRLGCCKKIMINGKIGYEIEISTMLENEDDKRIKEIIHHELLHTCKGCLNHGQKWKALAAEVNKAYGYNITTTARSEEINLANPRSYKYMIRCKKCGTTSYRMKKSKVVSHPENYRCSKCGGRLEILEKSFWN